MGIVYNICILTRGWLCSSLGRDCTLWVLLFSVVCSSCYAVLLQLCVTPVYIYCVYICVCLLCTLVYILYILCVHLVCVHLMCVHVYIYCVYTCVHLLCVHQCTSTVCTPMYTCVHLLCVHMCTSSVCTPVYIYCVYVYGVYTWVHLRCIHLRTSTMCTPVYTYCVYTYCVYTCVHLPCVQYTGVHLLCVHMCSSTVYTSMYIYTSVHLLCVHLLCVHLCTPTVCTPVYIYCMCSCVHPLCVQQCIPTVCTSVCNICCGVYIGRIWQWALLTVILTRPSETHWLLSLARYMSWLFTVSHKNLVFCTLLFDYYVPLPPRGHSWDKMLVLWKGNVNRTVSVLQYCVAYCYNGAQRYERIVSRRCTI